MIRRPPRSPLFPYTPLFRSIHQPPLPGQEKLPVGGLYHHLPGFLPFEEFPPAGNRAGGDKADRKSTRLNSSHLVISYAVFCLKKKKNRIKLYCIQCV